MKKIILIAVLVLSLWPVDHAMATEVVRVFHNGRPTVAGKPAVIVLKNTEYKMGIQGRQLWQSANDSRTSAYSKYSIVSRRTNVSDYLRSGRNASRGLTGISSSTLANRSLFSW